MTADKEKILNEHLIGVNKEAIKKHHDFLPSVLKAMEQYASTKAEEGMRKAFEAGVSSVVIARTAGRPIHLKMTRRFDEWYNQLKKQPWKQEKEKLMN